MYRYRLETVFATPASNDGFRKEHRLGVWALGGTIQTLAVIFQTAEPGSNNRRQGHRYDQGLVARHPVAQVRPTYSGPDRTFGQHL